MEQNKIMDDPITLRLIKVEEKELFYNINQKYLYEMTFYYDDEMDDMGNYSYGYFDEYFKDPKRKAFFIMKGTTKVGFVMLCPYSNIGGSPDHTIAEFTIFPIYRRKHYAIDAAKLILSEYHGKWEIKYNEKNIGGKNLWNKATEPYSPKKHHLNEKETVLEFQN